MNQVLVDASVAVAWLLGEPRPEWVDGVLEDARRGTVELIAPPLLWLEVGNALVFSRALTDDQATDAMLRLDTIGIEPIDIGRPIQLQSLLLARETGLTMYDATYLALAVSSSTPMATLDRSLEAAAATRGLSLRMGPSRASDGSATYGREADPVSVAAIGSALAELRAGYAGARE